MGYKLANLSVELYPIGCYYCTVNKIAKYVKSERKALGLTQEEFAMKSGLGLRFVRELEQGKETVRMDKVNQALAMFGMETIPGRMEEKPDESTYTETAARRRDMVKVYCYSKCSTCKKALKWLADNGIEHEVIDIKTENPDEETLRKYHAMSGLPLKRFFNTSGMQYRDLELAKKLPDMSEDEQFALLATDGMLVKRPLLVGDGFVLTGFKETEWSEKL